MKNSEKILFILSMVFGLIALSLWIASFYIDINMVHPLSCNVIQFTLIHIMKNNKL